MMTEQKNNDGKMKKRAAEKKSSVPCLYDPTQAIGLAYGAKVTPHILVLDQQRKIAYVGAVDDNMKATEAKTRYLRDALDALLASREPPKGETKPVGCVIRYEKKLALATFEQYQASLQSARNGG